MRCANCSEENPEDAKFCRRCGQPLVVAAPPPPMQPMAPPKKKHTLRNVAIALVLIIIVVAIIAAAASQTQQSPQARPQNIPPVPEFSFTPTSPKSGEDVIFNASASSDPDGTIVAFRWDFGDGKTGDGIEVEHSFTLGDKSYNIKLTVQDNNGSSMITTKPVAVEATWHSLGSASGIGDKTTDTFTYPGIRFRVMWTATSYSEFGLFILYVYKEGTSFPVDSIMVDVESAIITDTTYVYDGPGTYYFKISEANLESWSLSVEGWW